MLNLNILHNFMYLFKNVSQVNMHRDLFSFTSPSSFTNFIDFAKSEYPGGTANLCAWVVNWKFDICNCKHFEISIQSNESGD